MNDSDRFIFFFPLVPASFAVPVENSTVVVGNSAAVECAVEGDNPITGTRDQIWMESLKGKRNLHPLINRPDTFPNVLCQKVKPKTHMEMSSKCEDDIRHTSSSHPNLFCTILCSGVVEERETPLPPASSALDRPRRQEEQDYGEWPDRSRGTPWFVRRLD